MEDKNSVSKLQKVYNWLKDILFCVIGLFIGKAVCEIIFYVKYPGFYETSSAPWYTAILFSAAFTAVVSGILLIVMRIIKKKIK